MGYRSHHDIVLVRVTAVLAAHMLMLLGTVGVVVDAYQFFQGKIPNGDKVVRNGVAWPGVGHDAAAGGGSRNVFGSAFAAAGNVWTEALCGADSDGDGQSNGLELGDPSCVWMTGATPSRTTDISHPAFADSTTSATGTSGGSETEGSSGGSEPGTTVTGPLPLSDSYAGGGHINVMAGFDFHWRVEAGGDPQLAFALVAPTLGWLGVGIGEETAGSMPGADIMMGAVDAASQTAWAKDYYATGFTMPIEDCRYASQWTVRQWAQNGTHTALEMRRPLVSLDKDQDRDIVNGPNPTRLVFAHSASGSTTPGYHGTHRSMLSLHLFPAGSPSTSTLSIPDLAQLQADPETKTLLLQARNHSIPSNVPTDYHETECVPPPARNGTGFVAFLRAFETAIEPQNKKFVHHIVAKGYSSGPSGQCKGFATDIFVVASAHVPFILPHGVGFNASSYSGGFKIEIHYDNPGLEAGVTDSSGVLVYYTHEPQTHSAGVLQTGDPFVETKPSVIAPGGVSVYSYDCPGACTEQWATDVTVFGELLHMHERGYAMNSSYHRPASASTGGGGGGSSVIRQVESEYYQFHTQQNLHVNPFTVKRGDSITTQCAFKVPTNTTVDFGIGSEQEMCINFMYYYPVQAGVMGKYCGVDTGCGSLTKVQTDAVIPKSWGFCPPEDATTDAVTNPTTVGPTDAATTTTTTTGDASTDAATTDAATDAVTDASTDATTDAVTDATTNTASTDASGTTIARSEDTSAQEREAAAAAAAAAAEDDAATLRTTIIIASIVSVVVLALCALVVGAVVWKRVSNKKKSNNTINSIDDMKGFTAVSAVEEEMSAPPPASVNDNRGQQQESNNNENGNSRSVGYLPVDNHDDEPKVTPPLPVKEQPTHGQQPQQHYLNANNLSQNTPTFQPDKEQGDLGEVDSIDVDLKEAPGKEEDEGHREAAGGHGIEIMEHDI